MNSLFALRALLFAGECLLASTLILAVAWLATTNFKQASMRHLVWLAAFCALLVLPVAALIVPPRIVLEHSVDAPPQAQVFAAPAAFVPVAEPVAAPSAGLEFDARNIAIALFVLWLAGVCWAALRLAVGALGLRALRQRSLPHALDAGLPNLAPDMEDWELRLSETSGGPVTWGFVKPVILLPKNAVQWSRERLQAVLLHELAHVRRHDSFTQSLSLLACALYWPNPLIWIGARMLRREAEIAADDAVIVSGMKPSAYAGELLQLAAEFRGQRVAFSGVSMAAQSALEARVKSVLAPNQSRTGVTSMDALKIACLGFAATALLAFARPDVVEAQNTPLPPAPVAAPNDLPEPPSAPEALPPPPPPPAPEAISEVPPVPPAPPAPVVELTAVPEASQVLLVRRNVHVNTNVHTNRAVRVIRDVHLDQAQLDLAEAQAQKAEEALAKAGPEIEKAIAEAKIDEKVAKALADAQPRIRAAVARAMATARPAIRQAIADAHISEAVAKAMAEAQPKIDAAIAKSQKAMVKAQKAMDRTKDIDLQVVIDGNEENGQNESPETAPTAEQ